MKKPKQTEAVKTAYIAGQMTGLPDLNKPAFIEASMILSDCGIFPVHTAGLPLGMPYEWYIHNSLVVLANCDMIVLLDGWQKSKGANIERTKAVALGIPCYELKDFIAQHKNARQTQEG